MPIEFRFNVNMLSAVLVCLTLVPVAICQAPPTPSATPPVLTKTPVVVDSTTSAFSSANPTYTPSQPLNKTPTTPPINCTERVNVSECENFGGVEPGSGYRDQIITLMKGNKLMLMRAFYVLLGVTLIVVVYFAVRTIRWRSRNNRIKRYGLLSQNDDRLEMQPLDQDDDDEDDMTVFDINRK